MTLDEYFREKTVTVQTLATQVGVSQPYLSHIRLGTRSCPVAVALKIEAATEGRVTAAELNSDVALIEDARGIA